MDFISFIRYMAAVVFFFGQARFIMDGDVLIAVNATLAAIFIILYSSVIHTESRSK